MSGAGAGLLGDLLGDRETEALLTPEAEMRAMLRVEAALARVEARLGLVPEAAAAAIARAAEGPLPDAAAVRAAAARDGIAVPGLVAAFRPCAGPGGPWVHWGATSQDVQDTALVLRLRDVLGLLDARLAATVAALAGAAARWRDLPMAGRTRSQIAAPTTFGLRCALWADPLLRARTRLRELRPRLLAVSLFGAAGTLAALEGRGLAVMEGLAAELGLAAPALPWHSTRDRIAEAGAWLALVTGALGRIGADLVLLARSEIGELRAGEAGGSSTLPQKANPVGAESLVALARETPGLAATLFGALVHAEERDGAALLAEARALPALAVAAGAATRIGRDLAASLAPDPARMAATLAATGDLVMAEAAAFALARHMPRPEAQALVKTAASRALALGQRLRDVLPGMTAAPVDWAGALDPARGTGAAGALVDRFLAEAAAPLSPW